MKKLTSLKWLLPLAVCVVCLLAALGGCSLFSAGGGNSGGSGQNGTQMQKTFTVRLTVEGYSPFDFVDKNTNIIKKPSATPTKEGYEFIRWCSDEECTTELAYGKVLNSDLTIYAQWRIKTFTVTLRNTIEETESSLSVDYGEKAELPTRQAAGYTFRGWFTDEDGAHAYDSNAKVLSDITLYTGWSVDYYNINYDTDGGELPGDAPDRYTMFSATALPVCTRIGYRFIGWFDSKTADKTGTPITQIAKGQQGEKTFYAKYNCDLAEVTAKNESIVSVTDDEIAFPVKYTEATVDLNNYLIFSEGATYVVKKGETEVTINFASNTGEDNIIHEYTLIVTSESGETVKEFSVVITQYTDKYVSVVYHYKNASGEWTTDSDIMRQYGDKAVKITDPIPPEGYTFNMWLLGSLDGAEYDFDSLLSGDIDLYADYDAIFYQITYSLGNGANGVNPTTYTTEDAVVFAPATPLCDDYTFDGWYDSADYAVKVTGISLGSVKDRTVYARYRLKNHAITDYSERETVSLDELADYFTYLFYYRETSFSVNLSGVTSGTELEAVNTFISNAYGTVRHVDGAEATKLSVSSTLSGEVYSCSGTLTYQDAPSLTSTPSGYPQVDSWVHVSLLGRAETFDDFAIEHVADGLMVEDSEQLVYAVEHGYRPVPKAGSAAEEIYNAAKAVLRDVVDSGMTQFEKALAIYEYIIRDVSYDHDIFDRVTDPDPERRLSDEDAAKYYCFYLDGVFNSNIAVCDGYSKAFMLLCRIEGIPVVQVEGTANGGGTGHAWNKIYLSDENGVYHWYVVDCTSGDPLTTFGVSDKKEVMTHAYFLYTDAQMATRYTAAADSEFTYAANTAGTYYESVSFTWNETEYSCSISSDEQMAAFFSYLLRVTPSSGQISMDVHICLEDDEYDPFIYDSENKPCDIKDGIKVLVGSAMNSYNLTWTSIPEMNSYTFLCSRK